MAMIGHDCSTQLPKVEELLFPDLKSRINFEGRGAKWIKANDNRVYLIDCGIARKVAFEDKGRQLDAESFVQ